MSVLICGSMAFDTIMVFHDRFRNHILPEQVHILNVAFLVPEMRREFGGCAGNIAYTLNLLGGKGSPMATVGMDFGPYADWLDRCGIGRDYLRTIPDSYTAQAYITTDQDDNQITAFHPGAMSFSHFNKVTEATDIRLGIVSPDGRQGMIDHAAQFAQADIPFVFDPGQGMPLFDGRELLHFLDQATWVVVNDYEAKLMQERTGLAPVHLAEYVQALIITRGASGSLIYTSGQCLEVPVVPAEVMLDPTGCGDAYRAGLLYGLMQGMDWETIGRLASLLGSIKIAHAGTQNHVLTPEGFAQQFQHIFGYAFH